MKRSIIMAGSAIAAVAALLVVVPLAVPASSLKSELAGQIRDATGRTLIIEGGSSFRLLPSIGVTFERVLLSGPDGDTDTPFLRARTVTAELSLWSLLAGSVSVDALRLDSAVIDLRHDARGRVNWEFGAATQEPTPARLHAAIHAGAASAPRIGIRRVALRDAILRYHGPDSESPVELTDATLSLLLPGDDTAATLSGAFALRGQRIAVEAELETPERLAAGERARALVKLNGASGALRFDGHVLPGPSRRAAGALSVSSDTAAALFALAGASAAPDLDSVAIEARLDASEAGVRLSDLRALLGEMTATGELAVALDAPRPVLSGRLDFDALDFDRFAPVRIAGQRDAKAHPTGPWPARASDQPGDEPRLRLDGLDALDGVLAITAGRLSRGAVEASDAAARAQLSAGELRLELERVRLYDGDARGRIAVSAHQGVPVVSARLDMEAVDALALFRKSASFDWLSGRLRATVNLASGGDTLSGLRERLRGDAQMMMSDGALEGLDLPDILARLQSGDISELDRRVGARTRFTRLEASWSVRDGVAETSDLRLDGANVSAEGAGTVDMRRERLDMRLRPRVTPRAGDAGDTDAIEIPLQLRGSWHSPKIYPDIDAVMKDPSKSLGAAKGFGKAVERITGGKVSEDDFRSAIEGLLGGRKR